ncbi:MAG: tetratricopeptide repeat protein [Chitinophagaceae bacterium]
MKTLPPFLLILITGICACNQQPTIAPVIAEPDYKKGESFLYKNNDSAYYYYNKVTIGSRDSLQIAKAYNNMGAIQADAGDYFGSIESLLMTLNYLDKKAEKDQYTLLSTYNELGSNNLKLKNYDVALQYFDRAYPLIKDDFTKSIVLNNKALVYQKQHEYTRAIDIYLLIPDLSKINKKEYARNISNLANARWRQNPSYPALPELWKAQEIQNQEKYDWGLNASYAHLADYYRHLQSDSALIYANKMYVIAQQISSPDDELEALQKLISLSPPHESKQYFTRYQYLNDSIQTVRNAAKNQFALVRYEAEKSKSENLVLQKDNTEKKLQIIWQQILLYAAIFLFLAGTVIFIIWYKKRKQKIIREQQFEASKKVHDVVANGLYRVMSGIEHMETIEKEPLLAKLNILYERSRDLSYEHAKSHHIDFQETIGGLLTAFGTPTTKVVVIGNEKALWQKIQKQVKNELEHILQELMVNMKKHSNAQNVVIRFEQQEQEVKIRYRDDGIGLPEELRYGNGLRNTENRIKNIKGRIIFEKPTNGLEVHIYFPIA